MPGSSILPVSIHNNKLYFLFGKENSLEDSAPGFSDFGGGIEKGENPFETAVREGSEELTGFLGTPKQIRRHIKKSGGTFAFTHTNSKNSSQNYTVHIVHYPYDPVLPTYYNNNHHFLWDRMNRRFLKSTKLFEKIEIEWFCEDELKKRMSEYRPFYREVVETLLQKLPQIREFIGKTENKIPDTMRHALADRKSQKSKSGGKSRKLKRGGGRTLKMRGG
jgi:8-oxo-dGTP pyrophosphatase MutT (NUDIX family)